jgi:hypothetical protein
MKKSLRALPLFLIVIYVPLVAKNDSIGFYGKMTVLFGIILISSYLLLQAHREKLISNQKWWMFGIFMLISLGLFLYSWYEVN